MAERHIGIPRQTLSDRVSAIAGVEVFKTPSSKAFRVSAIAGADGNTYKVIEVADWFDLSMDILLNPVDILLQSLHGKDVKGKWPENLASLL